MLKGLGNGDYQLPLFVPASVTETAQLTAEAFDVADLYSMPAIVCIDGKMANMIETLQPFTTAPGRELPDKSWAVDRPLDTGRRMIGAARTPELDTMICYEIQAKLRLMAEREVRYETFRCDDAEIVVVAYGIMARIAREVVVRARAAGLRAGLFRPITLMPFPERPLGELAARANALLVTEINFGQALTDVRLAAGGRCPVHFVGQPAFPVPASVLLTAVEALAGGREVAARTFHDVHHTAYHLVDTHPPSRRALLERLAQQHGFATAQQFMDDLLGVRRSTIIEDIGR